MDQMDLEPRDLVPFLGSRSRVSEVLAGKRQITMPIARSLHRHLGIPAEILLQAPGGHRHETLQALDPTRFPLRAMAELGWIPKIASSAEQAEELVSGLMERAGIPKDSRLSLLRRNDHRRVNAKADEYALQTWCWQVMARANQRPMKVTYSPGTVTPDFLRLVAQQSPFKDGPLRARDLLSDHGIGLEFVPPLPKTYLDGAAMLPPDGSPVIGFSLRYDRIDNFWFCLLHELAHVGLHLGVDRQELFVDDLELREIESAMPDSRESEADAWAEEALVPESSWMDSEVQKHPTGIAVMELAHELSVHPAIVAWKVRSERGNRRLLSHFVGSGQIRRLFEVSP